MDVNPDWVKNASITEFNKYFKKHNKTEDERRHFMEMRRRLKNRVSGTWCGSFIIFLLRSFYMKSILGKCKIGHIGHFNTFIGSEFS